MRVVAVRQFAIQDAVCGPAHAQCETRNAHTNAQCVYATQKLSIMNAVRTTRIAHFHFLNIAARLLYRRARRLSIIAVFGKWLAKGEVPITN